MVLLQQSHKDLNPDEARCEGKLQAEITKLRDELRHEQVSSHACSIE
jgi:hypothetical protein